MDMFAKYSGRSLHFHCSLSSTPGWWVQFVQEQPRESLWAELLVDEVLTVIGQQAAEVDRGDGEGLWPPEPSRTVRTDCTVGTYQPGEPDGDALVTTGVPGGHRAVALGAGHELVEHHVRGVFFEVTEMGF
jgi:hypothetical protein